MLEFVFLIGILVFTFIYGFWCQREIADKRLMFIMAVFGGMIIGGASVSLVLEAKNDTSTTIGFWMEYAKMQLIDAEKNPPAIFNKEEM